MAQSHEFAGWAEISPFIISVNALHRGESHLKPEERMSFRGYVVPQPPVINNNAHYRNFLACQPRNNYHFQTHTAQNPLHGPFSMVSPIARSTLTPHSAPVYQNMQQSVNQALARTPIHGYSLANSVSRSAYPQSQDPFNLHSRQDQLGYIKAFVEGEKAPVKVFQSRLGPPKRRVRRYLDQKSPTPQPRSSRTKRKAADEFDGDYPGGKVYKKRELPMPTGPRSSRRLHGLEPDLLA